MDLYKEILSAILQKQDIIVAFPNLKIDAAKVIELECYKALLEIKNTEGRLL